MLLVAVVTSWQDCDDEEYRDHEDYCDDDHDHRETIIVTTIYYDDQDCDDHDYRDNDHFS